ncbi:hypothetical protein GRF29_28g1279648 [Pseudopithomyces chartarum]|uniref:Uncharacterized protein n=1 Tax=Pseudopithomyces chartarum TaxID=1892770 RepID=A0AAN6RJZ8_9PLEO|nr:hypothetical protein GRF29_28g1279648 [Pseudopithomyces chartarum]
MKYAGAITMTMAALSQLVNANFDLYHVSLSTGGVTDEFKGWHVYEAEVTCDFTHEWVWRGSGDVSGNKFGVHCKERDGALVDLSDNQVGRCVSTTRMAEHAEQQHITRFLFREFPPFEEV